MESGYYEEIAGTLLGLLIRLENRLDQQTATFVAEEIDEREFGVALEAIVDKLSEGRQPIEPGERADMLALAKRMQLGEGVFRALSFCPNR